MQFNIPVVSRQIHDGLGHYLELALKKNTSCQSLGDEANVYLKGNFT